MHLFTSTADSNLKLFSKNDLIFCTLLNVLYSPRFLNLVPRGIGLKTSVFSLVRPSSVYVIKYPKEIKFPDL